MDIQGLFTILTVQDGPKAVGRIEVRATDCTCNNRIIEWMEVEQEYRRRGVAKHLLTQAVHLFRDKTIIAAVEHEYLHSMYKSLGFTNEGTYSWEREDGSCNKGVWFYRYPSPMKTHHCAECEPCIA